MNQLEKPASGVSDSVAILDRLALHGILLSNRDELELYLAQHAQLAALLDEISQSFRIAFGPVTELALELYADPEIDDHYLTLYVRQEVYDADIIDRIDAKSAEFHRSLEAVSGYFLVTTDFRHPRGTDVL